jgi:hypothetical protein
MRCVDCLWSDEYTKYTFTYRDGFTALSCRRYPPKESTDDIVTVNNNYWCGEFKLKLTEEDVQEVIDGS